ncbi:DUF7450 family protein [Novipirellula artificiosorum]|uniref:DUF7450 domain-containing protein n=1 Tax=Novipirellula artificiosorum TaxID=2528016 RepID=A0A5C6D6K5_9BACT|nr:hypothetical protein [Novipirellula artificiosorum]TWU31331.1 hypothetical protein Poly41_62000 [Novipirellula artificiosorum]
MPGFRCILICLMFFSSGVTTVLAHSPVDFLEVLSVKPARSIQHTVELQGKFDSERVETDLEGPLFFSRSVGCMGRAAKKQPAYLNWFKIVASPEQPERELFILDMVRGDSSKTLKIKQAEYLLSPSQLITSGVPDAIPGGLDHYKAYRVVDAPSLDRQVTLTGSVGSSERRLGKPIFVCLPVREWHHDEYFSASHSADCFVVYALDEQPHDQKFSLIDQFGLNGLTSVKNQWLCVRAAILRSTAE